MVRKEIDRKDSILLGQIMAAIAVMLNEMDSLNLNFGTNPEINFGLKRILRSDPYSLTNTEIDKLAMIRNFIDAPANSRPHIHSINVYMNNDFGRFLTTTEGLTSPDAFFDTQWYVRSQTFPAESLMWTEVRNIRHYAFERESKRILSIYRRLFSSEAARTDGVHDEYGYIVQNLHKTFIERSYLKIQLSERMYRTRTIELLALQPQMNPHFLFNTLETINWKVLGFTGKPNEANEMITNLSGSTAVLPERGSAGDLPGGRDRKHQKLHRHTEGPLSGQFRGYLGLG